MANIAVVGAGNWGKNLVRNYYQAVKDAKLVVCCDKDEKVLQNVQKSYPGVETTDDFESILKNDAVDAVVIATTPPTHHKLASMALKAGKHVYVEKPLTLKAADAEDLVRLSKEHNRVLMVGHLLLHHPAVHFVKQMIDNGDLGEVYYLYFERVNLGIVRPDENAWWSLAPHDISVALYLLGEEPKTVSAKGSCYLQKSKGIEDVVFATLEFPDNKIAHIHVSWLDPHKERKVTIVGSKKMVVFDDMASAEKIKIFDKGAKMSDDYQTFGEYLSIRQGDIHIPKINMVEPLKLECQHFVDAVNSNKTPLTDGEDGLRVVKVLESGEKSLKKNGEPVAL